MLQIYINLIAMESSFNHPAHQGLSSMHSPFSPYSSAYKPSSTVMRLFLSPTLAIVQGIY